MYQTAPDRVDLPIVKHHLACPYTINVDGKNGVPAGFRTENGRQISQWCERGDGSTLTAINDHGDPSGAPRTAGIILASAFAGCGANGNLFVLSHNCSRLQTF